MIKKAIVQEERKWKRIRAILIVAFAVCMIGYAVFISFIFETFVGKATGAYEVTDTSIVVNQEDYKYVILKGYITKQGESPKWFYYATEADTILKEEILQAEESPEANIILAKTIIISDWEHPWLHELCFVAGVSVIVIMLILFCIWICRIEDEKLKKGKN